MTDRLLPAICEKHFPSASPPCNLSRPQTGKFNQTIFFSLDGRDLVLRMAPPPDSGFLFYEKEMMAQEPRIHTLVREKTGIPVPEILVYDNTRDVAPQPFLVMERLPGIPLTAAVNADTELVFARIGGFLSELHENVAGEQFGYVGAHQPMKPAGTWPEAFGVMWHRLIDDIAACGGYKPEQEKLMRESFERDRKVFDHPVRASLLHMDIWHQNILVNASGNVTGILDWDRALWGDPEIEFAVLDYCGISTPGFWQGYGCERDTSPEANLRGIYYYLYELQKYIVIRTLRGGDPINAQGYALEAIRTMRKLQ